MLTEHVRMYVALADIIELGQTGTKSRGVENRTGTDNLILRNAGELVECIGHNIDRVADDDVDCLRSIHRNLGRDVLHNVDIGLSKLKSRLTGLSRNAGCNDDDIGAHGVAVITCDNAHGTEERSALKNIHGLALSLLLVHINQNDVRCGTVGCESECDRRSDASRANDSNLHTYLFLRFRAVFLPLLFTRKMMSRYSRYHADNDCTTVRFWILLTILRNSSQFRRPNYTKIQKDNCSPKAMPVQCQSRLQIRCETWVA